MLDRAWPFSLLLELILSCVAKDGFLSFQAHTVPGFFNQFYEHYNCAVLLGRSNNNIYDYAFALVLLGQCENTGVTSFKKW